MTRADFFGFPYRPRRGQIVSIEFGVKQKAIEIQVALYSDVILKPSNKTNGLHLLKFPTMHLHAASFEHINGIFIKQGLVCYESTSLLGLYLNFLIRQKENKAKDYIFLIE
jgi:hypothetical protein